MKVTMADLIPFETLLESELRDPEFRAEWERLAPARALAIQLVGYRADHGLTLATMARLLGISRREAADLEAGDTLPSPEMLLRVTEVLDASRD
ncbi:MAG: helix-turn-helix transcriptional regulator [Chloroflexia bacterium]|nr:helix-turn-helix transcriptional regulator [Chloroflexia bacterium]